jgi:hypothetical protein
MFGWSLGKVRRIGGHSRLRHQTSRPRRIFPVDPTKACPRLDPGHKPLDPGNKPPGPGNKPPGPRHKPVRPSLLHGSTGLFSSPAAHRARKLLWLGLSSSRNTRRFSLAWNRCWWRLNCRAASPGIAFVSGRRASRERMIYAHTCASPVQTVWSNATEQEGKSILNGFDRAACPIGSPSRQQAMRRAASVRRGVAVWHRKGLPHLLATAITPFWTIQDECRNPRPDPPDERHHPSLWGAA